uniref:Uncharacterized protein n=1 Tax=Picea glauca TaxID=3330 RepID=A0A101LUF1_PICGL|nr:hypothetical protein ABT39_MTgene2387 [Picea glauca]QHR88985.1 hypothetical protein Q903MT_gene3004 [Picea sitchensis]
MIPSGTHMVLGLAGLLLTFTLTFTDMMRMMRE